MLVRSDTGFEVVNIDQTFAVNIGTTQEGAFVLVALGGGMQTPLVIGSKDRCQRALQAIQDGVKQRTHIVDLLGLLGQRPDLAIPQPQIIRPGNGDGRH
jgi:hypothetical protein